MARRAAGTTALIFAIAACGGSAQDTTAPPATNVSATTIAAGETTTTAAPPQTTTRAPTTATSTTTLPPKGLEPEVVDGSLPLDTRYVIYGADGIVALTTAGDLIRITTDPTAVAFAVGDSLIVSQAGMERENTARLPPEGPIQIHQPDGVRELPLEANERMILHDAGTIESRGVIVATSIIGGGWDLEENLLLIDVASGHRTELGTVGYYEAGVEAAKLNGGMIIVKPFGQDHLLESRLLSGETAWIVAGPNDFDNPGFVAATDSDMLLVNPGFVDPDFTPVIEIARFDLASGERTSVEILKLDAHFGGGFCHIPDWDGTHLVCEESYGGPFSVDLATGSVTPLTSLQTGMVSAARAGPP